MTPLGLEREDMLPQSCLLAMPIPLAEPNVLSRLGDLHIVHVRFRCFLNRTWLLSPNIAPTLGGRKGAALEKQGAKLMAVTRLPSYTGRQITLITTNLYGTCKLCQAQC